MKTSLCVTLVKFFFSLQAFTEVFNYGLIILGFIEKKAVHSLKGGVTVRNAQGGSEIMFLTPKV